jgi:hypothetical protein
MPRRTLILCLASLLAAVHGFAQQARTSDRAEPSIDVHSSGAIVDGTSDDTQPIAAAAKSCVANGGVLYLPYTRAAFTTTKTVELPANCDYRFKVPLTNLVLNRNIFCSLRSYVAFDRDYKSHS